MSNCKHEKKRKTGDMIVLSDGFEVGICICLSCGEEVPEAEEYA